MTKKPKLPTEAEWQELLQIMSPKELLSLIRERGLVAPEPVDPLLEEAREIGATWGRKSGDLQMIMNPDCWRDGSNDQTHKMTLILAALRRGMELQREAAPLTPKYPVPEGQTPLDDNLSHRCLEVFREGMTARDEGTYCPSYSSHSLEHGLHAWGWVLRDLRLALDAANERIAALTEQVRK